MWDDADTFWCGLGAALLSLVATGLMHVLLLFTPRPICTASWRIGRGRRLTTPERLVSSAVTAPSGPS
jgi:hypothetical protein